MSRSRGSFGRLRRVLAVTVAAAAAASLVGLAPQTASADPVPQTATPPATVTADALPTWQINGVVWSQAVVGNTVYVTGSFTKARPPGVAVGGAGEIDAKNVFAYDITTGNRVPLHPLPRRPGHGRARHPTAPRIYVGGDFTERRRAGAQPHRRLRRRHRRAGRLQRRGPTVRSAGSPSPVTRSTSAATSAPATGRPATVLAAWNAAHRQRHASWAPSVDGDGYVWSMVTSPDRSGSSSRARSPRSTARPRTAWVRSTPRPEPPMPWAAIDRISTRRPQRRDLQSRAPTASRSTAPATRSARAPRSRAPSPPTPTPGTSTGSTTAWATPTTASRRARSLYSVVALTTTARWSTASRTPARVLAGRRRVAEPHLPDRHHHQEGRLRLGLHRACRTPV